MTDKREGDMLVNLYALPAPEAAPPGVRIYRAFPGEKARVLRSLRALAPHWAGEVEVALSQMPATCFLAFLGGKPVGFACYDATAKGYFGPTGVLPAARGKGIGRALLLTTLYAMRDAGYGYAIVGWAGDAAPFYKKTVGARFIEGGEPQNTLYASTISFISKEKPPR